MTTNYEVGYAKPPADGQFQKGKSGNPKGRPKSKPPWDIQKFLIAELKSSITLTMDGKKRTVSKLEALVKSWLARALKGEKGMMKSLLDYIRQIPKDAFVDEKEIEAHKVSIAALEMFVAEASKYAVPEQEEKDGEEPDNQYEEPDKQS